MVDFATPVQEQQSQPYFWAKPTSEPKPDTSGLLKGKAIEEGLKGGASALREGVQGINTAYEKGIQNAAYAAVDPIRDQYMERLHSTDQILQGRETPDPLGRDAPRDVKGLPGTLNTLDSARANGKLSQTDYDARLNALAKEIRGKYPGYREYVDETFKRVTGRDSANQYIKSVIGDIDSYITARKGEASKLENKLLSVGFKYKEGNYWYQKVQENPDKYGPQALSWLNGMESKDHSLEMAEKLINFEKSADSLNREKETDLTNKGITESGAHYYTGKLDTIASHLGLDPKTNDRYQDILNKMRRGEYAKDIKPEEAVQLRTFMQQQWAAISSERAADLSHHFPNMKTEEIQKVIESEFKTSYEPFMEALGKGNFSLAEQSKNLIKAQSIEAVSPYYDKGKWANTNRVITGLHELDPPMANQIAIQAGMQASTEMSGELTNAAAAAVSPPAQGGKPFGKIAQEMQVKNIKDGRTWKSMVELYSTVATKGPQAISNENADALINSAFGPENADVLKYFAKDDYFHSPGKPVVKTLGQQYVFNTFTSDGMIDRIAKRSKDKPELYQHFKNWANSNVQYVLTHDVLTSPEPRYGDVRVSFDDKTSSFDFKTPAVTSHGQRVQPHDPSRDKALQDLQSNMRRMAAIADKDPNQRTDPTVTLYGTLKAAAARQGAKLEGSLLNNMIKAIEATRQ